MAYKYTDNFTEAVLANANRGGENVHSGIVIGALLGAAQGAAAIPSELKEGLSDHGRIAADINDFVAAVTKT